MKYGKRLVLLLLASNLSFNSCSSMDSVKNFFEDPMKSSAVAVIVTAPLLSFVFFKIGAFLYGRKISKSYEKQKKLNEDILKQKNELICKSQKQQNYISDLNNKIESLNSKIKSLKEESDFYKDNLYSVYDQVEKYSKCILEGKNKINEIKQRASLWKAKK